MAAAQTYEPIATTTLGSATNAYTFSSIPSTYTDLILVATGTTGASATTTKTNVGNGSIDTGANYSVTRFAGTGSAAAADRTTGETYCYNEWYANWNNTSQAVTIIHFFNYANTTTYKTFLMRGNNVPAGVDTTAGLWRSTSAINTIQIAGRNVGSVLNTGTTLTLYGIKAA